MGIFGRVERIDQTEGVLIVDFDGREIEYPFGELDSLVPAYATTITSHRVLGIPRRVITLAKQHYTMSPESGFIHRSPAPASGRHSRKRKARPSHPQPRVERHDEASGWLWREEHFGIE